MRKLALPALLLALACQAAHAQAVKSEPYLWKSAKITAGGFITGIVFSPKEAGLAYCRTDIGGAYRFDAKLKQWVSLTDWVGPRNSNLGGCESVAPDPLDPEKIYLALGTYSGGQAAIARSADRGKTFQTTPIPLSMGGNEDGRGMGERLDVDPSDTRVLYFGSRGAGLWRSTDAAVTWAKVDSFPVTGGAAGGAGGGGGGGGGRGGAGITWIVFDTRKEDKPGQPTPSIFVGVAAGGTSSLYHSADAGKTWAVVPGAPAMMPHRATLDPASHTLYISYGNGPGPNNVSAGSVQKYDIDAKKWTAITPNNPGNGGYGGITLDRQHPNVLMVSTIDHWGPADAIFRSTDAGATWKSINATANRQTTGTPYMADLLRGHQFDWWLAALAIDPFDSNHVMYGTGACVWGTHNMTEMDGGKGTLWNIESDGIEETAVLALASPPWGEAHLISGVGDIGGFTHTDLNVSPAAHHQNPGFSNTNSVEFADLKPVVVRTGNGGRAGYSEDGGITWRPINGPGGAPAAPARGGGGGGGGGGGSFILSADGTVLLASNGGTFAISKDKAATWTPCAGLPNGARPFADRVAPTTFYALDTATSQIYTSTDGGATFTGKPVTGLPQGGGAGAGRGGGGGGGGGRSGVKASFAKKGDLWLLSAGSLYHSTDVGLSFAKSSNGITINNFSLGKAAPNHDNPALFASGTLNNQQGLFRSDDNGANWVRINDDQHQYGGNPSVMTGDPRVYGRLFIGLNGRGVQYGDPAPAPK